MNIINKQINILIEKLNKNSYGKLIVNIIINGEIPYFNFIKKYLIYISIFSLYIFIEPQSYKDFGEFGMNLLIIILFISPLSKIFPKFKILNKILLLRRQIGILIGFFIFTHILGFFILNNVDIVNFLQKELVNYKSKLFWGLWGTIFMILPFITSNTLSQKILKNKWKIVQQLTYFFFIFGEIHIYLIKGEIFAILTIFIWIILKFIAYKKLVILK